MPMYVGLLNWTDQGVKNVKETTSRAKHAREAFESMGVKMDTLYWTAGRYDLIALLEAPDDKTLSAAILRVASQGAIRSELLRAYDEAEMSEIIGMMG